MYHPSISFYLLVLVLCFIYTTYYYRRTALYDDLTGLLRRGRFEKELVLRMTFVKNNPKYVLHFYMIDLDNFKSINDIYGHKAGDEVLCSVSKSLRNSIRKLSFSTFKFWRRRESKNLFCHNDIIGRLGGDEFGICCIMLQTHSSILGTKLGERLNKAVVSNFESTYSKCSISIGISIFDSSLPVHVEKLKNLADKNLYCSKKNGKGCTTI